MKPPKKSKVKKYLVGGTVKGFEAPKEDLKQKYQNDFASNFHDASLGAVDNGLSVVGAGNVIKKKNYLTKFGAEKGNQFNNGVQQIGPGIAGAALNYFYPGLGTLLKTGTKGIEKVSGTDEGLDQKDSATQQKVGNAIDVAGNLGISKNMFLKKKTDTAANGVGVVPASPYTTQPTTTTQPSGAPTTTPNPYTGQTIDLGLSAAQQQKLSQDPALQNRYNDSNTSEADKQAIIASLGLEGKKAGGIIKGAGTGTSDSIKVELDGKNTKKGDFVIPAKQTQTPVVEGLLKHLGIMQSAPLSKSKGGDVALSNGESLIPSKMKGKANNYLNSMGISGLAELAPNADDNAIGEHKDGYSGEDDEKPKRKNSTGSPAADKIVDDLYSGKYKTKKDINEAIGKVKSLTLSGNTPLGKNAEIQHIESFANDEISKVSGLEKMEANKILNDNFSKKWDKLAEPQIKKLEEAGATPKQINDFKAQLEVNKKRIQDIGGDPSSSTLNPETTGKGIIESIKDKTKAEKSKAFLDQELVKADNERKKVEANPDKYTIDEIRNVKERLNKINDLRNLTERDFKKGNYKRANSLFDNNSSVFKSEELRNIDKKKETVKSNPLAPNPTTTDATTPNPYAPKKVQANMNSPIVKKALEEGAKKIADAKTQTTKSKGIAGVVQPTTSKSLGISTLPHESTLAEDEAQATDLKNATAEKVVENNKPLVPAVQETPPPPATPEKRKYDWAQGVGGVQTALGGIALSQDGTAPIYTPNAQLIADAESMRKESDYGYNPLTMSGAKQDITLAARTQNREAMNLTGGDAGSQLAFQTATGLNTNKANTDLAKDSETFRLQKKQAQYNMDQGIAGEMKYAFENKLNLFNQRQMAGAQLMQKGIENVIGSQRYQTEQEAIAKRENTKKSATAGMNSMTEADYINRYNEKKVDPTFKQSFYDWKKAEMQSLIG